MIGVYVILGYFLYNLIITVLFIRANEANAGDLLSILFTLFFAMPMSVLVLFVRLARWGLD